MPRQSSVVIAKKKGGCVYGPPCAFSAEMQLIFSSTVPCPPFSIVGFAYTVQSGELFLFVGVFWSGPVPMKILSMKYLWMLPRTQFALKVTGPASWVDNKSGVANSVEIVFVKTLTGMIVAEVNDGISQFLTFSKRLFGPLNERIGIGEFGAFPSNRGIVFGAFYLPTDIIFNDINEIVCFQDSTVVYEG